MKNTKIKLTLILSQEAIPPVRTETPQKGLFCIKIILKTLKLCWLFKSLIQTLQKIHTLSIIQLRPLKTLYMTKA